MFLDTTDKDITYSFESLNQIISEVAAKMDIPEGVFVEKVFDNGLQGIRMHRQSVERVISTILNNALSCISENGTIILKTERKSEEIVFHCVDTGISSPNRENGINELLCRKIIEDQRGRIEFFNNPSRGNCVTINFPL